MNLNLSNQVYRDPNKTIKDIVCTIKNGDIYIQYTTYFFDITFGLEIKVGSMFQKDIVKFDNVELLDDIDVMRAIAEAVKEKNNG